MRFHTRLIVPSIVSLVALQFVVPQGQPAARAEESELVLKTAGEEAKAGNEGRKGGRGRRQGTGQVGLGRRKKDEDTAAKRLAEAGERSVGREAEAEVSAVRRVVQGCQTRTKV